jgi:hypothetical protein
MISTTTKSNYLARVVTLPAPRKHSNADRLLCINILSNNVITGLTAKEGDLYVYFPLECTINKDFLRFTNSFANPEDNADGKTKGFFGAQGRVKALKLRGERSEGYIVPVAEVNRWLGTEVITYLDDDQDFDTIDGKILCEKYVNRQELINADKAARADKRKNKKVVRTSKLVENQFRLSADTAPLKRNIDNIKPDDTISVSYKYHGANVAVGRVLCKKKLTFWNKVGRKLGFDINETHYDLVYSSRAVVKNEYNDSDKRHDHYYGVDVWGVVAEMYKDTVKNGVTLYGELVGFTPTGSFIQKGYDYNIPANQCDMIVYRITYTSATGDVFEFNAKQITDYCNKFGLKRAELFYHGKAKDMFADIPTDDIRTWQEQLLAKLCDKYLEKKCHVCKNDVPAEGIVLVKEGDAFDPYKLKAFAFLERETKELDSGAVNIEEVN